MFALAGVDQADGVGHAGLLDRRRTKRKTKGGCILLKWLRGDPKAASAPVAVRLSVHPPAPAASPAHVAAVAEEPAPVASLAPIPAAGKCKFHPRTAGRFYCGNCTHFFCELCVNSRNTAGVSHKYCRHCGAECTPVQIQAVKTSAPWTPPKNAAPRPLPTKDADGESLPSGAFARLGSLRFQGDAVWLAVRYLPDGQTLAGFTAVNTVLWDARTGKLVGEPIRHRHRTR